MLHLYANLTKDYLEIYNDFFLPSVQDDFIIHTTYRNTISQRWAEEYHWQSIFDMFSEIKNAIKLHEGEIILRSDVDIQFFQSCEETILETMDGVEVAFLADEGHGNKVNGGFMGVRCNSTTYDVFDFLEKTQGNQRTCQSYLDEKGIPYSLFPRSFYCTTQGKIRPPLHLHHSDIGRKKKIPDFLRVQRLLKTHL